MQTYNKNIFHLHDIDKLVKKHTIEDNEKLLIQFFSAVADIDFIRSLQQYFQNNFPLAIEKKKVYASDRSLVVFSLFDSTTLQSSILDHKDVYNDHFKAGHTMASNLITDKTKVLITFTDGINTNGEEYLKGVSSFAPNTIVSGGMAGDNGVLHKTYVFDKNHVTSDGAVAVTLDSDILEVTTSYSFDWMPIGKQLSVSKSVANRVYEIDGMTTVELYEKYLGEDIALLLPQLGIEFPLIIERNGLYTARAVLIKHDDGSLTFAGNILEGELVRFGIGNVETILRGGDSNLRGIVNKASNTIESFFIYSCMARRRFMGNYIEKELAPFSDIAPTTGFFTYGEFFHTNKKNLLLNESMSVLALSEKKEPINVSINNTIAKQYHDTTDPIHVISHLTNTISNELENLNTHLETRIQEDTELIHRQAYYDSLTGLPNRLKLINNLNDYRDYNLLLLNIDEFNLVNDFYGHHVGDNVLKHIATELNVFASREDAIAFKLPADEFALILQSTYSTKELEKFILKLIHYLRNHYVADDYHQIKVDVTVSCSKVIGNGTGLAHANMALKLAKQRNISYLIFDQSLMISESHEINLNIATTIREAISNDNIIPYYQPLYDSKTNKINKYECLVRLQLNNGSILTPYDFLEVSKKIKLYPSITKIMIDKTFAYFCKNGLNFSINLSLEDILTLDTNEYLFTKMEEFNIAKQLTIEILENQEVLQEKYIKLFINKIYEYGANIAIDDFGSGFANFQHIVNIKADYLKIDGSLIANIDTDDNSRLIVETIVIFAQKLGMKTVAEFVHSKEIYDIVRTLDIDLLQGYYLDKPLPEI